MSCCWCGCTCERLYCSDACFDKAMASTQSLVRYRALQNDQPDPPDDLDRETDGVSDLEYLTARGF